MSRVAVAFPGQGSQKVGMAHGLGERARLWFTIAEDVLGYNLKQLCDAGPAAQLGRTCHAQPALLVTCYALWEQVKDDYSPYVFAGHSLGLVTAMVATGCLEFAQGVAAVARRGELMDEAVPGGMVAVLGLERAAVMSLCEECSSSGWIQVANYNAPGQIVVSGELDALSCFEERAKDLGAKRVIPLDVSGPFHSQLMTSAAEKFSQYLSSVTVKDPEVPLLSNSSNKLLTRSEQVRRELVDQLTRPVLWVDNVNWLVNNGITEFVEVGPSPVLIGLVKRASRNLKLTLALPKGDVVA